MGTLTHRGPFTHPSSCQPPGLTSEAAEQDGEPQQEGLVHFGRRKEWVRAGSCKVPIYASTRLGFPRAVQGRGHCRSPSKTAPLLGKPGTLSFLSGQCGDRDWLGKSWARFTPVRPLWIFDVVFCGLFIKPRCGGVEGESGWGKQGPVIFTRVTIKAERIYDCRELGCRKAKKG